MEIVLMLKMTDQWFYGMRSKFKHLSLFFLVLCVSCKKLNKLINNNYCGISYHCQDNKTTWLPGSLFLPRSRETLGTRLGTSILQAQEIIIIESFCEDCKLAAPQAFSTGLIGPRFCVHQFKPAWPPKNVWPWFSICFSSHNSFFHDPTTHPVERTS